MIEVTPSGRKRKRAAVERMFVRLKRKKLAR
jgi:hypothetical protein